LHIAPTFTLIALIGAPAFAGGKLVWVESQEAPTAALAEAIQELAGPVDLFRLLSGSDDEDYAGQALATARLAWKRVQTDAMPPALMRAAQALRQAPRHGDAARMQEVLALQAAHASLEFRTDESRSLLSAAYGLGLRRLPSDLHNAIGDLLEQVAAKPPSTAELIARVPSGARLIVDDRPWDLSAPPRLALGLHLIGARAAGHRSAYAWVEVTASGAQVDLLPQAAPELGRLRVQLAAAARGEPAAADNVRRTLGLDSLIACTLTLVASRYDARCRKHSGGGQPIESVASFRPDEPIAAHARRLFESLQRTTPLTITATVNVRPSDPGKASSVLGWTSVGMSAACFSGAGFFQYRAGLLHDDYRATPQSETARLEDVRRAGKQAVIFANIGAVTGVLFGAVGAALVLRGRSQRSAMNTFVGGAR
jgi:hypothetical protein